jgi:hypothetical protein
MSCRMLSVLVHSCNFMLFMKFHVVHIILCTLFNFLRFMSFYETRVIYVNSCHLFLFMSDHAIHVNSCQFMPFMSFVTGLFRKFSKVEGGREGGVKYVYPGLLLLFAVCQISALFVFETTPLKSFTYKYK